jgi:hypothetical protein
MNMTKGMDLGPDTLNSIAQISAPQMLVIHQITYSHRRSMRDKHVRLLRDQLPLLSKQRSARQIESPIQKRRLPWRSPKRDAIDAKAAVLQVSKTVTPVPERFACAFRSAFKGQIMIARDYDLSLVGQCSNPVTEACDFAHAPNHRKVSSMDEHIPIRDRYIEVPLVRVRRNY